MPSFSDRAADILGQAVVAAIVAIVGTIIFLWVDGAGLRSDLDGLRERYVELHDDISQFRKPGARYTAEDGDRDRAEVAELKTEFHEFVGRGSRSTDDIKRLQKRVDTCSMLLKENSDRWHLCAKTQAGIEAELFFLRMAVRGDEEG